MSWAEDHLNRPTVDDDGNPYYPDERREAWAEGYDAAVAYVKSWATPAPDPRRCPGGGTVTGIDVVRLGPDRVLCPSCGRNVSAHRITGTIARHNRPTEDG